VDDQRVGRIVRALRRRLGWRQLDVAIKAGCSQTVVSQLERGHLDVLSTRVLRRILAEVGATAVIEIRWRAGALDRLLDEDHAVLVARVAALLRAAGWFVETEVTYSEFGERGSYDLLAFHSATRIILVVEVKTDLATAEGTLRKIDEKARLASQVALKRFGWRMRSVAVLLVFAENSTLRKRVARHAALFDQALPMRNVAIRNWLPEPSPVRGGIWFLSPSAGSAAIRGRGGRERVRAPKSQSVPERQVLPDKNVVDSSAVGNK
jgi:transcriptional regulator with XRE-family HTH domain